VPANFELGDPLLFQTILAGGTTNKHKSKNFAGSKIQKDEKLRPTTGDAPTGIAANEN
jgi:hypothetical protein